MEFGSNIDQIMSFLSFSNLTLIALILLTLSLIAYFSKMEIAFFSLSTDNVNDMTESDDKREQSAIKLISAPQYLLATFIIVSNVLLALFFVFTLLLMMAAYETFKIKLYLVIAAIIIFLLMLFLIIWGKSKGAKNANSLVLKNSTRILTIQQLFLPFVKLLGDSKILENNRLTKWNLGLISKDDLSEALDLTEEQQEDDMEMIEGVIKFGNLPVADIMTQRADMAFIDITLNFKKLIAHINELGFSRMPVFANNKDNIKGILFIKDLLPHLDKPDTFRWQSLVRQAFYVPETKKIDDLLNEFQENRIHLALVVDEYGGISGLVTLEDIIEEIVGDISDEYDEDETLYEKIDDHNYIFEAKIEIEEFCEIIGANKDDFIGDMDDVETLAGLILELKGEMPQKKDIIETDKYRFEIFSVDKRRIKKLKLTILDSKNPENIDS